MAYGISRICQFLRRSPRAEFVADGRREAKAKTTWEVVWFLGNLATRGRDLLVGGIEIRCSNEGHDCAGGILGVDSADDARIAGIGAVVAVHGIIPPEHAGDEVANGTQLLDGRHRKLNVIKECASHEPILRKNRAPAIRLPHCNATHSRGTTPKLLM